MQVRILLLDIETAPNLAFVWGLFKQNIAINQIEESSYILCWSAKWLGEKSLYTGTLWRDGHDKMLKAAHKLLDSADVVVHYNGRKFDIPTLNKEFITARLAPPAPYKQVDLMQECKRTLRFESNKLDFVAQQLKVGAKVRHEGFSLWVGCMRGDKGAQQRMERYNRGDVTLLEPLYLLLRPWIRNHPNHSGLEGVECCPKCGSRTYQSRGEVLTQTSRYQRYACKGCGGWFRGSKSVSKGPRMSNIVGG